VNILCVAKLLLGGSLLGGSLLGGSLLGGSLLGGSLLGVESQTFGSKKLTPKGQMNSSSDRYVFLCI